MKRKNILITGGLGYIGGRLGEHLINTGRYEIFLTTHQDEPHLPNWIKPNQIKKLDVTNINEKTNIFHNIDTVIHLAGLNNKDCTANPTKANEVNAKGTQAVLKHAIKAGVQKFIYFSTMHVYGSPLKGTLTEDATVNPTTMYALTHKLAEDTVIKAHKNGEINGVVLRLSNSFGAPASQTTEAISLVANQLCHQAAFDNIIHLIQPFAYRNFIPLTDVVVSIEKIVDALTPLTSPNCIYNMGGPETIHILHLAKIIKERAGRILDKNLEITWSEQLEPADFTYDISKLIKIDCLSQGGLLDEIDSLLRYFYASSK